ncbi:MAG: glycosyltransferase family 2 protein [Pseudomonadota bacterium]
MTTAAIVVTFHTGGRLKDCLHVLRADPEVDAIIIVDNGNPAAMAAWLDRFGTQDESVLVRRPGGNLGFGRACNLGADATKADHLLFLNPDTMLRRGSVSALLAAARDARAPWIVGGKIFDIDGREQRGGRRETLTLARALGLAKWGLHEDPPPDGPIDVGAVSGAFFLMDRAQFQSIGGFDPGYFLHVEDVDLCRRARETGGSVIYQPAAAALHFGATSGAARMTVERHKAAGLARYFRKFANGPLERAAAWALTPAIYAALLGRAALRG